MLASWIPIKERNVINLYGKLYLIIKIAFTDFLNFFFDSYIYIAIHLKKERKSFTG